MAAFCIATRLPNAILAVVLGAGSLSATATQSAESAPSLRYQLERGAESSALRVPQLDVAKVLAEEAHSLKGQPQRYALSHRFSADGKLALNREGRWHTVGEGLRLWRLRIDAPGALSIDLALSPFQLPAAASLYLTDASGTFVRGPYSAADNPASGTFWTPFVPGDVAYVEVLLPAAVEPELRLQVAQINQAYRDIFSGESPYAKSGSCNVDVVCPQGDGYREQIRAVARYTVSGGACSGQLINNTGNDGKRLFITANHCVDSQSDASGVVVYWNYESPTCRTPNSGSSGIPLPVSGNSIAQTGGGLLRANHAASDTALLELNNSIPGGVTPYWDGWDRSESAKSSAVVVHHPNGDEKRISLENNPLSLSDVAIQSVPGSRHWRVADWDLGTTEQGSSGSGLLSPEKRLIGVLSGGAADCGNDLEDYFGRLSIAWEGGGSSSSRVRDWLDPGNSGSVVLDGRGSCNAPVVSLSKGTVNPTVDAAIVFTASISGGTGPYTVRWDVDGDGVIDRTVSQVGQSTQLPVRYPIAASTTLSAQATDATGCAASAALALDVSAPDIVATATAPTQVCGDGDGAIEPGERWQLPVQLANVGGDALNNAFAQFTQSTPAAGVGDDGFDYKVLNSGASADCRFQAVDMSGASVAVPDESDDGVTAGLPVGGSTPFRFYGSNLSQLRMATNGYLSSSAEEDGGDFNNVCGGFGSFFDNNARLHVLHDDLVMQAGGSLRHQRFATCPRPADAGGAQGCTVFQWNNLGRYTSASTPPDGNAVFQAILYDQSYEIVYQYLTADPLSGGGATISIENAEQTERLEYSCNTSNQAPPGRAVCFFEPSALPPSLQSTKVNFEGAAQQSLPNLSSGQSTQRMLPFSVPTTATCGAPIGIRYVGTVDDFSSSNRSVALYSGTLGNGGSCQTSNCAVSVSPLTGMPRDGLYSQVNRSGNGIGLFNIAVGDSAVTAGTWFSGRANRLPTWYLVNGAWSSMDRRADLTIFQFNQSAPGVFPAVGTQVGTGVLSHDGAGNDYVMSWTIDGVSRMDKLARTFTDASVGQANHTGLWNTVGQSGWGVLIDEHLTGGNAETLAVDYLYDQSGAATWVLGAAANLSGSMSMNTFQVHCPWCPNITDFASVTFTSAGTQSRSYSDSNNGLFGSTITVPAHNTVWNRDNLPIRLLTTPLQ